MATYTPKRLGTMPSQLTTSGSSALYTTPGSTSTIIKSIIVANTTSSNATFNFSIVTAVAANSALVYGLTVAGNSVLTMDNLSVVLQAGESFFASASAATTLTLTVSGVEIS
jgi:hypothetical protein